MLRSISAVVVGYLVMGLALAALFLLAFPDPRAVPSTGFLWLSIGYGLGVSIVGGYVCGLVAGRMELQHAIALAALGAVLGIVSSLLDAEARRPLWYVGANLLVLLLGVPFGGFLRAHQRSQAQDGMA